MTSQVFVKDFDQKYSNQMCLEHALPFLPIHAHQIPRAPSVSPYGLHRRSTKLSVGHLLGENIHALLGMNIIPNFWAPKKTTDHCFGRGQAELHFELAKMDNFPMTS